jgi:hypothetical protein
MKAEDATRLKELERENVKLERIVADRVLEIDGLREIAKGDFRACCADELRSGCSRTASPPGDRDAAVPGRLRQISRDDHRRGGIAALGRFSGQKAEASIASACSGSDARRGFASQAPRQASQARHIDDDRAPMCKRPRRGLGARLPVSTPPPHGRFERPTEGLNLLVKKVKRAGHGSTRSATTGCAFSCTPEALTGPRPGRQRPASEPAFPTRIRRAT